MNTTKKDKISKAKNVATFDIVNPNAAGIDIGSKEHWVCVPSDRDEKNVRKFSAFTHDLYNIADWLQKCGITSVAMESTGVYWVPLFQVLDSKGFEVFLVNSSLTKSVPGRPKTDALDCQWIRRLHSCGLLRASFRPEDNVCKVRSLLRHRDNLIRSKSKTVNHMHKALEQMNIKITKVLSDITGVTGLKIINAILDGNRDFANIAACADPRIKASQDTIVKSLHGDYREEHLFTLKQSLHTYNFFSTLITECDQQLESFLITLFQPLPLQMNFFDDSPTLSPRKKKSSNNQPSYNGKVYLKNISGVDLTKIPGVEVLTAQNFLFEVGLDMNKWPSEKHFSSWLAIAPLKILLVVNLFPRKREQDNLVLLLSYVKLLVLSRTINLISVFFFVVFALVVVLLLLSLLLLINSLSLYIICLKINLNIVNLVLIISLKKIIILLKNLKNKPFLLDFLSFLILNFILPFVRVL